MNRRGESGSLGSTRRIVPRFVALLPTTCVLTIGMLVASMSPGLTDVVGAQGQATLTKQALDPNGNPIANGASVLPGAPVKWVLGYNNTTGSPANAVVTDPIDAGQTFVPGSLQTPPTWTKEYSADGTNVRARS